MENSAKLRVTRGHEYFGSARNLKLYIDGELTGLIPANVTREFLLLPGRREIVVKMDWYQSEPKMLNARAGSVYSYAVTNPSDMKDSLYFLVFMPKQFFRLQPAAKNNDEVY